MSRHQKDPLRPLTADERTGADPPEPFAERPRRGSRARPSAVGDCGWRELHGRRSSGRTTATTRPSPPGSAASTARGSPPCGPRHGGGPRIRYGADAQQRILAEWARTPERETGRHGHLVVEPAAESLAPGSGRPAAGEHGSRSARTLHEAGLSWQKSRTWCETGVALRNRKHGVVRVSDPGCAGQKKLIEQAYTLGCPTGARRSGARTRPARSRPCRIRVCRGSREGNRRPSRTSTSAAARPRS